MEQLLHSGSGGGNAGGGTVAYDAGGSCRILPGIECSSSGFRGGDTLAMAAGTHRRFWASRGAGTSAAGGWGPASPTKKRNAAWLQIGLTRCAGCPNDVYPPPPPPGAGASTG